MAAAGTRPRGSTRYVVVSIEDRNVSGYRINMNFSPVVTWKTVIGPEVNRTHDSVCIILTVIYLSKFKLSDSRFGVWTSLGY